jgi:hypothetical protein
MAGEPENLVLVLLRGIGAEMRELRAELKGEMSELRAELKADIHSLRADVASDLLAMQVKTDAEHKETRDATRVLIEGLRRGVSDYHSSVVGHGILISELDTRMRRVEQHLNLSPIGSV